MPCPAKPVLTKDLCIVQKEEFNPISRQRGCYLRNITAKGSTEKKKESLVVCQKGLDAKTN
jgi:hypothetical protein